MKRFSLRQSARLLGVGRSTLRRWLRTMEMTAPRSGGDRRRRTLSHEELAALALRHGRMVLWPDQPQEAKLDDRVAALEKSMARVIGLVDGLLDREAQNKKNPDQAL